MHLTVEEAGRNLHAGEHLQRERLAPDDNDVKLRQTADNHHHRSDGDALTGAPRGWVEQQRQRKNAANADLHHPK